MSHLVSRVAGGLRKVGRRGGALAEGLESRRLLAAVSFGTPISTALPSSFTPVSLIPTSGNGTDVFNNAFVVTGSVGGLLLKANNDGTFSTLQTLTTTATILGTAEVSANGGPAVPTVITTSGLMSRQNNGTFSAPTGLTLPSDAVAGTEVWDPNAQQVLIERFRPNNGDPSKGSVILASFRIQQNGIFGSETDTTVLTNVVVPPANHPLWTGQFTGGATDVIADGVLCQGIGDGTFNVIGSQNLPAADLSAPGYSAFLLSTFLRQSLILFPAPTTATDPNSDAAIVAYAPTGTPSDVRVDMASKGTTSGPLLLQDLTKDNTVDMAVAVTSGTGSPAVSIAPGVGDGTFMHPVLVSIPSLVALAGVNSANGALLCFTGTGPSGGPLTYSLSSLPNTSIPGPVIQLVANPSSAFVNQSVAIKATESSSNSFPRGATMDFFDGATKIGTAPIGQDGTATLTMSTLTAGVHTLTAQDETYGANDVSAPISLTLNADPPHPLVSVSSFDAKLPTVITPGDKGFLTVNLSNVGAAAGTAKLAIKLYATASGVVDNSAIPIPIPSIASTSQAFGVKKGKSLKVPFNVPDTFAPGSYQLVLTLDAATGSNASYVIPATIVHDSPVTAKWQFGTVGDRKNVKFVQHLTGGGVVTFSLIGAGTGTITTGPVGGLTLGTGSPDYSVFVDGTNVASKLSITQSGSSAVNILNLTLNTNIGILDVAQDTPHSIAPAAAPVGGEQPTVSVGKLYLGTLTAAQLAAGSGGSAPSTVANVTINGGVGQLYANDLAAGDVTVGKTGAAGQVAIAKVGKIAAGGVFQSAVPIAQLQMGSAAEGSLISAPSLGKLTSTSDFNADLTLTQPTAGAAVLGFVQIGGSINASALGNVRWAVNGNIGKVQINGAVKNFELLGGAKLGPAGELTTPPAAYSGTSIFSITIRGAVTSSLLAAGLDPVDGLLMNSDDKLLPGGSIGAISVTGSVSPDSRFEAASLPAFAVVGGAKVATTGDPRFKSS
jgi:hypothetical protein